MPHFIRLKNDRSGSALIISLLIITTLVGLTIAFSEDTGVELELAGYERDQFRAHQGAFSGIQQAMAAVARDENPDMDSLAEEWAQLSAVSFPEGFSEEISISGEIMDESAKFNVNVLVNEKGEIDPQREHQLHRLLQALEIEDKRAAPLLDWLDSDDIERMNGAESAYYRGMAEPYSCGNGLFVTTGQLQMVKGIQAAGLIDYLTVYTDGRININTASQPVLRSLGEQFDETLAQAVVAFRKSEPFQAPGDLKKVPGVNEALFKEIEKWISVKSSAFSATFEGTCRETRAGIRAVVKRDKEKVKLVYWRVE